MSRLILTTLLLGMACSARAQSTPACEACAVMNVTQAPFRIYGNSYYVGVHGLSSVLITSKRGHVLIDGGLPESAPKIAASIRALGFRPEDIRLIVNSHVHHDHAGGIASLQKLSGARVAASRSSAEVLERGASGRDDPQYGKLLPFPPIARVKIIGDGETLRVGPIVLTAHFTPGHTPGGTSWTWKSCEQERCLNIVYADSLTAVSAPEFKFTRSPDYPQAIADFEKSFATLSALPCDILISTHPDASGFWTRFDAREHGGVADALVDPKACVNYVEVFRERLKERVTIELTTEPAP